MSASTAITIDQNSRIDVTGKGYLGGYSGGNSRTTARTYGNTTTGASTQYNGGSYGGVGGIYYGGVNAPYGDLMSPNEVGSGGGGDYYAPWGNVSIAAGGNGGGLVKIMTGNLALDGQIVADGVSGYDWNGLSSGGGSGGGISINASTLSGVGTISARGGASTSKGAGGGGRIAVYYDILTLPTSSIVASGGKSGSGSTAANGGAGTVYLKSSAFSLPDLILDNGGITTSRTTPVSNAISQSSSMVVSGGAVVTHTNP